MSMGALVLVLVSVTIAAGQYEYKRPGTDLLNHNNLPDEWSQEKTEEESNLKFIRNNNINCDIVINDVISEITSPNYPNEYPSFSNCRYTILPSNEGICQVSFYFHEFDVEDSPHCRKDSLLIGDEPFCGKVRNYRTNKNLTNNLVMRFVSDSTKNGRGFRITLEQIPCGNTLRYQSNPVQPVGECCSREYKDPYMILTSPGFLGAQWTESNCRYVIFSSRPNVCRLRFSFKRFWVGDEDVFYGCVHGFLEIDRRRFCGCLDGYEYVSHFEYDRPKELWYSHIGPGNRGFVIEVYQEECGPEYPFRNNTETDPNTEIEVFMTNITSEKAVSRFLIPRDGSRCYDWGQPQWSRQIHDFLGSSPVPSFCQRSTTASQFYPFPEGDFPLPPAVEPSFLPPAPPPPFIPPLSNCIILNNPHGFFSSQNYPGRYPANFGMCYLFQALHGHCRVQVKFLDFDLEKSFKCLKDYVLVRKNIRYCGNYFHGKTAVFDFGHDGFFSFDFVTDCCFAGRGFLAKYRQIPCVTRFGKYLQSNDTN